MAHTLASSIRGFVSWCETALHFPAPLKWAPPVSSASASLPSYPPAKDPANDPANDPAKQATMLTFNKSGGLT